MSPFFVYYPVHFKRKTQRKITAHEMKRIQFEIASSDKSQEKTRAE